MRNSKTPTLVILCLLGVIGVITYNYWSATQRHLRIKEALFMSEEKINELIEKKAYADKQIGLTADRAQKLEKELEEALKASEQKDKDVSDMNERMKKKEQERDKFALENSDLKENLRKAQTESILAQQDLAAKTIEFTNQIERYKQELENSKKESINCGAIIDAKIQELRNNVANLARAQFNMYDSEKIQGIFNNAIKNSAQNAPLTSKVEISSNAQNKDQKLLSENTQVQQPLYQSKLNNNLNSLLNNNVNVVQIQPQLSKSLTGVNEMRGKREIELKNSREKSTEKFITMTEHGEEVVGEGDQVTKGGDVKDVCQLPKVVGTCEKSIERYFFDSISQRCLLFVYTGCNGNDNNFETIQACKEMCQDIAREDKPTL